MWCHDVGREHGAGKPLLRTIFQENFKLFDPRKVKLLFVIRDRSSRTPFAKLVETLREDMEKIWEHLVKPEQVRGKGLEDFFDLHFTSLPNFEEKEKEFNAETVMMRSKFTPDSEHCLLPTSSAIPGHAFAMHLDSIWNVIEQDKDLDLPAHKIMVASVKCDQAIAGCLADFEMEPQWLQLQSDAMGGAVADFGMAGRKLLAAYVERFESQVEYLDQNVCTSKEAELLDKLVAVMRPALIAQLERVRVALKDEFRSQVGRLAADSFQSDAQALLEDLGAQFYEGVTSLALEASTSPPEAEDVRARLAEDFQRELDQARSAAIDAVLAAARKKLAKGIASPSAVLLQDLPADMWYGLRKILAAKTGQATEALLGKLAGFELGAEEAEGMVALMRAEADKCMGALVEDAAESALPRLTKKFDALFCKTEKGVPRTWSPKVNIEALTLAAKASVAGMVALLAVSQLGGDMGAFDGMAKALAALADPDDAKAQAALADATALNAWKGASEEETLLSPSECRDLWKRLEGEVAYTISQAVQTQEANKRANANGPPLWTILMMFMLGWNELKAVLFSPFLLIFVLVTGLFARNLYIALDVDAEMENGLLPGLISLSAKVVPVAAEVSAKLSTDVLRAVAKQLEVPAETAEPAAAPAKKKKETKKSK